MRKKILTVLVVPLVAALTAQAAAAASEHHHTRMKSRAVASEQLRNSNAYAALGSIVVQPDLLDEGAMTSGMAGH